MNEVVEINVGIATLEKSQTRLDPNKDQIYGEVRDTPCSDAFPILHKKAKSLKCIYFYICTIIDLALLIF